VGHVRLERTGDSEVIRRFQLSPIQPHKLYIEQRPHCSCVHRA
jgi:hypothetical protein